MMLPIKEIREYESRILREPDPKKKEQMRVELLNLWNETKRILKIRLDGFAVAFMKLPEEVFDIKIPQYSRREIALHPLQTEVNKIKDCCAELIEFKKIPEKSPRYKMYGSISDGAEDFVRHLKFYKEHLKNPKIIPDKDAAIRTYAQYVENFLDRLNKGNFAVILEHTNIR